MLLGLWSRSGLRRSILTRRSKFPFFIADPFLDPCGAKVAGGSTALLTAMVMIEVSGQTFIILMSQLRWQGNSNFLHIYSRISLFSILQSSSPDTYQTRYFPAKTTFPFNSSASCIAKPYSETWRSWAQYRWWQYQPPQRSRLCSRCLSRRCLFPYQRRQMCPQQRWLWCPPRPRGLWSLQSRPDSSYWQTFLGQTSLIRSRQMHLNPCRRTVVIGFPQSELPWPLSTDLPEPSPTKVVPIERRQPVSTKANAPISTKLTTPSAAKVAVVPSPTKAAAVPSPTKGPVVSSIVARQPIPTDLPWTELFDPLSTDAFEPVSTDRDDWFPQTGLPWPLSTGLPEPSPRGGPLFSTDLSRRSHTERNPFQTDLPAHSPRQSPSPPSPTVSSGWGLASIRQWVSSW